MTKGSILIAAVVMLGWTTGPARAADDPLETFNRQMFHFNSLAVEHVINPMVGALAAWIPQPVRTAGANIYANLTEPEFIVTNLFKGQHADAAISGGRFLVNSTLGVAGVFEVADGLGLKRRETEFGEALCSAGVPAGPYLVLPLIGPANLASAGLITGFFAVEWYALSLISSLLATADLVVDLSASAASLRHADEVPQSSHHDPYAIQRADYLDYMSKGCPGRTAGQPAVIESPRRIDQGS